MACSKKTSGVSSEGETSDAALTVVMGINLYSTVLKRRNNDIEVLIVAKKQNTTVNKKSLIMHFTK